jgi:hypothetical protein
MYTKVFVKLVYGMVKGITALEIDVRLISAIGMVRVPDAAKSS